MKYTVPFGQVVLLQVCLCLLLVSLSDGQRASKTGRPAKTVKPKRSSPKRGLANQEDEQTDGLLLPWVEPPETCGKRPALNRRSGEGTKKTPSDNEATGKLTTLRPKGKGQKGGKTAHCVGPRNSRDSNGFYPSYVLVSNTDDSLPKERWFYDEWHCGGALVGKNVVVTAAHCVDKAYLDGVNVTVGIDSPNQKEYKIIQVKKIWFHSDACDDEKSELMDFAILILKNNVTYTDYIQPACFQPNFYHPPNLRVNSFPSSGIGIPCAPSIGHKDNVQGCNKSDSDHEWLRSSHNCYQVDMCRKQYGAPLYYLNQNFFGYDNRHAISGLASFVPGDNCSVNGTYFFDFYRARRSIPLSLDDSVDVHDVDPNYSDEKCFLPKKKKLNR